MRCSTG